MPDDFLKRVSQVGAAADEIIPKALAAGGEIVADELRRSLASVLSNDEKNVSRRTGKLEDSIGVSKTLVDRDGNYNIKVGFADNRDDDKVNNSRIANVIENGKKGQPPRPFIKPAMKKSESAAKQAIIETFDREVSKFI
jgi:HK97 gp10 family phage protein